MTAPDASGVLEDRALVLNVTYQALSITTVRRALVLMLSDKVDVVHTTDDKVRSASLVFLAPSVVRLRSRAPVPHRRRAALHRRAVFARDDHECQYCGRPAECIDHVHPRSRGGEHSWENVVACCRQCNVDKGDRLLSEFRFDLARAPYAPEPLAVAAALRKMPPPQWLQYLPPMMTSKLPHAELSRV